MEVDVDVDFGPCHRRRDRNNQHEIERNSIPLSLSLYFFSLAWTSWQIGVIQLDYGRKFN